MSKILANRQGKVIVSDGKLFSIQTGGITPQSYEWQQTSEAVQGYLDFVANNPYSPDDYTYSVIQDYAPSTPIEGNERPIGQSIATSAGTLSIGGYTKFVTAGNNTIYNAVPNTATPYVLHDFGEVKQTGTLKPTKKLRQIMTSARNVRDLGGWNCDGGTVKYGMLFRGGEVTRADRDVLVGQLGVRHDLDLRGTDTQMSVSPLGIDIKYTRAPNYNWYKLIHTEDWRINLRCIFDAVKNNEPVYFHCSAGADRTGTLACVVEALLGMSQSDIDADYELTCFCTGSDIGTAGRRRDESDWRGLIGAINKFDGETFRDKAVAFVVSLGITVDEINAFRTATIDGTPEPLTPVISALKMNRTLTGGRTQSGGNRHNWVTTPPDMDYAFAEFDRLTGEQKISSGADRDVVTDMSENSVSIAGCGAGQSVMYSVALENGKQYKLTWDAEGTPRVYVTGWVEDTYALDLFNDGNSVDNATGNREYAFTVPSAGTIVVAIGFGAGTNSNAHFSNVKLIKI